MTSQELCLKLMSANSEAEVIAGLQEAGYWDNPAYWRHYGDNELNWSQAGAQQSRADFALNEKVINALDSLLTRMCMAAGIAPEGPHAPRSVRQAVAMFIEKTSAELKTTAGRVEDWPNSLRREVRLIKHASQPSYGRSCLCPCAGDGPNKGFCIWDRPRAQPTTLAPIRADTARRKNPTF